MRLIYDGISIENDSVVYNDVADAENDIMNIVQPDIYKSEFEGNTYYFGYRFKDSASRKERTTIIFVKISFFILHFLSSNFDISILRYIRFRCKAFKGSLV